MTKPKVSVVQYLNTVPLIWGMVHGGQKGKFELSFTTPAGCADDVRQRQADVGIIPSIEYQRIERLRIISGISISARAEVKSVLLLSKVPIEDVRTVAADNSSRTSAALLAILLKKFYRHSVQMTPSAPHPGEMLKSADAALVIGDPALTYNGPVAQVYDLAAEWKKFTGLPFVFAFWAGHEDGQLARFRQDFEDSRDYGLAHVDEIAAEYAPRFKMKVAEVKLYLTENINYSLDEEHCEGLCLFYKLARELGIIAAEKDLVFL